MSQIMIWKFNAVIKCGNCKLRTQWHYVENCGKPHARLVARNLAQESAEQLSSILLTTVEFDKIIVVRLTGKELRKYLIDSGQMELPFTQPLGKESAG